MCLVQKGLQLYYEKTKSLFNVFNPNKNVLQLIYCCDNMMSSNIDSISFNLKLMIESFFSFQVFNINYQEYCLSKL